MFGHREVYEDISAQLTVTIEAVIKTFNVGTFLVGGDGQFDRIAAGTVRRLKGKYPYIRLILVRPYWTKELLNNKEYYYEQYDDIIIPEELLETYYRNAITMRNRWMVEHSDCIISYQKHDYGGAYTAIKYAEKCGKLVVDIKLADAFI